MKLREFAEKLNVDEGELFEIITLFDRKFSFKKGKLTSDLMGKVKAHYEKEAQVDVKEETNMDDVESVGIIPKITIKGFAEALDLPLVDVMTTLVKNGFMMNLNSIIDFEIASIIAEELRKKVHLLEGDEGSKSQIEEVDLGVLIHEKDKSKLSERAPIVSVIGHVDHGKTSLLDYIRKTDIVSTEAGAITQSIGAYQAIHNGKEITFLDTPGHEAFVAMRRRGVRATDIAILVIAADDGIKAQTIEAIYHAKEAGVPIVVAISKIDKEGANVNRIKEQLTEHNLLIEEWGGSTIVVPISAKTGEGMNVLMDSICLVAEMAEFKADPDRSAIGTVIESNLDQKLGAVATVVIHTGKLQLRDVIVIGDTYGRVRALLDFNRKQVKSCGPSVPVLITGLNGVPQVGDILKVVPNERMAKDVASNVAIKREDALKQKDALNLELISRKVKEQSVMGISIILRADTEGSIEAIKTELERVKTESARIRVIRSKTGDISESDISLAQISNAFVVAFNSKVSSDIKLKAQDENIHILKYDIIYKMVEDLTEKLLKSIAKTYDRVDLGKAEVLKIFLTEKKFMILGVKLNKGKIRKGVKATVIRGGETIGDINISKIQLIAESVNLVEAPIECGITIDGIKIEEGDKLEIYELVEKKVELI